MYTKIDDNTMGVTEVKKIDITANKERKAQLQAMIESLNDEIVEIDLILDEADKLGITIHSK